MTTKKTIIISSSIATVLFGGYLLAMYIKRKPTNKGDKKDKKNRNPQTSNLIGREVKISDLGYTNIRSSATIDDGYIGAWFGARLGGNVIGEVDTNPVGNIIDSKNGDDGLIWYKIKLKKPIEGKSEGWVREDAVNLK